MECGECPPIEDASWPPAAGSPIRTVIRIYPWSRYATRWACALLVAVFLLSALAVIPTATASPIVPSPKAAAILRIGELQQPDSLNVFVGVESASYIVWAYVYEDLVGVGPDLTPIPALAKDWSVDATQKIWTFHLLNNVTWHDGVPFTSEDVNFTFRYIAPAPIGCNLALLNGYLGDFRQGIGVDVANITTPDPYTVVIPTFQPKANILSMLIQIVPKHIWNSISCNNVQHVNPTPVVGTGMYKFTAWQRGAYVQLDLNPNYWRLDKSKVADYVQTILIEYYTNSALLYTDFTNGQIDASGALTAQQYLQLQSYGPVGGATSPNVGFFRSPSMDMIEMGACLASDAVINQYNVKGGRNWLVTNRTIRQAMQLAVNRSILVDNILGTTAPGSGLGIPGSTLIPPGTPYYHLNVTAAQALDSKLAQARRLLDDPDGDGFTLVAGHVTSGDYGQWLDPNAANNADAFGAVNPSYPNIRVPINPARVRTGDEWGATGGASAPNRAAPYPLSFGLDVINTAQESSDAADLMVTWWAQVGIQVTKTLVSESKMISVTYACSEDFYMWGWGMDVDPDFAMSVMTTNQILNWQDAWYSNATYDADYLYQQTRVVASERQQTIWRMQDKLYQDAAYLIMWYPDRLTVVRTDTFTGWTDLGSWTTHPGLGITVFWNDLVILTVRGTGAVANNCPTVPVLSPSPSITAFAGRYVTFSGLASDPDAGQTLTWTWNWGDGNTTQNRTPSGSNVQVVQSYRWNATGTYNVVLTVNDGICPKTSVQTTVSVVLLPANIGWIAGTVRSATNAPIANATVLATPGAYPATTDPQGRYNITVPVGTYTVTATRLLYANAAQTGVVVAVNATTTVNLVMTSVGGWIVGLVTAAGGGALTSVAIYAVNGTQQFTASTDANGRYNMSAPAGIYAVNATLTGYYVKTVTGKQVFAGAATTVDFALDPLPQPLSPLVLGGIAAVVIIAVIALAAFLLSRKRKKEEEIQGPPMPPPKEPGTP